MLFIAVSVQFVKHIGTPKNAQQIEDDLHGIGITAFLVKNAGLKNMPRMFMYEIYCKFTHIDEFERRRNEIQEVLDITIIGAIKLGRTSHHKILHFKKGKPDAEIMEVADETY
jgi:hypothetical protein